MFDRNAHIIYQDAPQSVKGVVDDAFDAAAEVFKAAGWTVANDDRAESVVAALTRFAVESMDSEEHGGRPIHELDARAVRAKAEGRR